MENKNVNILWSGGHKCALCLTMLIAQGYKINALISFISKDLNEIPYHGIPDVLIKSQAKALNIPSLRFYTQDNNKLVTDSTKLTLSSFCKKGLDQFVIANPDGLYAEELSKTIKDVGGETLSPLAGKTDQEIFQLFLESGNKAITTSIQEEHLKLQHLGRELSPEITEELLKYPQGSFQTFTTYTPNFKARLTYSKGITTTQDNYTVIRLREV